MKRILAILIGGLFLASGAALADVVGSQHDLSTTGPHSGTALEATNVTQVCVFCHTPHQATAASKQDPLWNHTVSSVASYALYSSNTLNANLLAFGGGTTPGSLNVSQLCMSCHDGTVGVGALYNNPGVVPDNSTDLIPAGNTNLGSFLDDDHPVNFTYDSGLATEDGGLNTPSSNAWVDAGKTVPLFTGTVQCGSCHDPHDTTYGTFLVKTNAQSALCTTCHTK